MTLDQVLAPYVAAPATCAWEPLTDDVFTDEFWRQFPDGEVPIRQVPTYGVETLDVYEWATQMMARWEAARAYDLEAIDDLCSRWHLLWARVSLMGNDQGTTRVEARSRDEARDEAIALLTELGEVTRSLLGHGLSMRALARYLRVPAHHVARAYCRREQYAAAALAADDLVEDTMLSSEEIARQAGYYAAAVRRLRQVRGIDVPAGSSKARTNTWRPEYEPAMRLVGEFRAQGLGYRTIVRSVVAEMPEVAPWLTTRVVRSYLDRRGASTDTQAASSITKQPLSPRRDP